MAYFDIVGMEAVDRETAATLGFKKIYGRKDISVAESLDFEGRCIIKSSEPGLLGRSLRRSNVEGIIIKDNELMRQTVEEAREQEKLICFPIREITNVDTRTRMRSIYRMRGLMAFAVRSRARIALVTLAENESEMLSRMQMVEIAKFLGAAGKHAEEAVSSIGDLQ